MSKGRLKNVSDDLFYDCENALPNFILNGIDIKSVTS